MLIPGTRFSRTDNHTPFSDVIRRLPSFSALRSAPSTEINARLIRYMPPPARVCQACKACKVRCDEFVPGQTCSRCDRLGLICEPAPQRPKLMSTASRFMAGQHGGSQAPETRMIRSPGQQVLVPLPSGSGSLEVGTDTAAMIYRQVMSEDNSELVEFCLRAMACYKPFEPCGPPCAPIAEIRIFHLCRLPDHRPASPGRGTRTS